MSRRPVPFVGASVLLCPPQDVNFSPQRTTTPPVGQLMHRSKVLVLFSFFFPCRRHLPADYDSDSGASRRIGRYFRVAVKEHMLNVHLSGRDLETAKDFVSWFGRTDDPGYQPFQHASWPRMRTLLGRIISRALPRLWEAANHGTELGSHEFGKMERKDARVRAYLARKRAEEGRKPVLSALPVLRGEEQDTAGEVDATDDVDFELRHALRAMDAREEITGLFERLQICDDQSFFQEFKEYLAARGRPAATTEQRLSLIGEFSRYNQARNKRFSLARLCRLFHESRREDVLLLPRPWDWLEEFHERKIRDAAHCAYSDLLDFLGDLLVLHRGRHISINESASREQHLQEIEVEVLAHHPFIGWTVA